MSLEPSRVGIIGMHFPLDDTVFKGIVWVMEITHFLGYSRIGNYSGLWMLLQFNAEHMIHPLSMMFFGKFENPTWKLKD